MNRQEHLLTKIAEEAVEVAQRATKALRFGLYEVQPGQGLNNAERLRNEFIDLVAALDMVEMGDGFNLTAFSGQDLEERQARVEKYLAYSETLGTLTPEEEKADDAYFKSGTRYPGQ